MYSKWLAYFDSWCLSLASFKPPPFSIADSPSTKGLISGAWIFKAVAPFIGYEKPIIKNTFRSVKKWNALWYVWQLCSSLFWGIPGSCPGGNKVSKLLYQGEQEGWFTGFKFFVGGLASGLLGLWGVIKGAWERLNQASSVAASADLWLLSLRRVSVFRRSVSMVWVWRRGLPRFRGSLGLSSGVANLSSRPECMAFSSGILAFIKSVSGFFTGGVLFPSWRRIVRQIYCYPTIGNGGRQTFIRCLQLLSF